MIFPLLALLGIGLLLSSSRAKAATSSSAKPLNAGQIAQRIVRETQEIIDGKRTAYTDSDDDVQAELARARKAAELAQQKEARTPAPANAAAAPAPAPKPKPSPSKPKPKTAANVGPTQPRPTAPPGTDIALAKQTSAKLAAHLKQAGRDRYDRKVLKLWQTRAGIAADGIYGRGSAAALKYFTPTAPAPFFAQGVASYTPPA